MEALKIKRKFKLRYSQAATYNNLGMVFQAEHDFVEAKRYLMEALRIFREFKDHFTMACTYHQLGSLAEEEKEYPRALEYYTVALEIWLESKDQYHLDMVKEDLYRLLANRERGDLPGFLKKDRSSETISVLEALMEKGHI
ncbi:MAG: tetratricopeptide repeat protein [bacterium]|nr:tetratricopeptide repeat protein [bacterium]